MEFKRADEQENKPRGDIKREKSRKEKVYNEIYIYTEDERERISITWRGTCKLERAVQEVRELMNEVVKIRMR